MIKINNVGRRFFSVTHVVSVINSKAGMRGSTVCAILNKRQTHFEPKIESSIYYVFVPNV